MLVIIGKYNKAMILAEVVIAAMKAIYKLLEKREDFLEPSMRFLNENMKIEGRSKPEVETKKGRSLVLPRF